MSHSSSSDSITVSDAVGVVGCDGIFELIVSTTSHNNLSNSLKSRYFLPSGRSVVVTCFSVSSFILRCSARLRRVPVSGLRAIKETYQFLDIYVVNLTGTARFSMLAIVQISDLVSHPSGLLNEINTGSVPSWVIRETLRTLIVSSFLAFLFSYSTISVVIDFMNHSMLCWIDDSI